MMCYYLNVHFQGQRVKNLIAVQLHGTSGGISTLYNNNHTSFMRSPSLLYIHLSWEVIINRIRLDDLIYSLKSSLQLNMFRELQIFAFVYMYSGAS